jgi:hypothetical protein
MKKPFVILAFVGLAASAIFAFYAFNLFIYNEKQDPGNPLAPYTATLTGEYVCLPHKDTRGPVTLECAFGLKTESGEHYALDLGNSDSSSFVAGQTATLSGTITPLALLSTDHWQKYNIEGILSIE